MNKHANNQNILSVTNKLVGQKAWGVQLGIGSFIKMEFGSPKVDVNEIISTKKNDVIHGEWHLWIYFASWRLESHSKILTGSSDSREKIKKEILNLNNLKIINFNVLKPYFDAVIEFENSLTLRVFSTNTEDSEHWMLFTPEGKVLSVGPGTSLSYEWSSGSPPQNQTND